MNCWHKWSKWEQYESKTYASNPELAKKKVIVTEWRQKRKCLKCDYEQNERIR